MIKRYVIGCGPFDCPDIEEDPEGDWVRWEDVKNNQARDLLYQHLKHERQKYALELSYGLHDRTEKRK